MEGSSTSKTSNKINRKCSQVLDWNEDQLITGVKNSMFVCSLTRARASKEAKGERGMECVFVLQKKMSLENQLYLF